MSMSPTISDDEFCAIHLDWISQRAFEKWVARSRTAESSVQDWLQAEAELHQFQQLVGHVQELEQRLSEHLAASKQVQVRLVAEHAVSRILSVASTLGDAAPGILQSICESLDFHVGALWIVDRSSAVLRCAEIFQSPGLNAYAFVEATRNQTFAPGVGLPGRVWASQAPISIPNVVEDWNLPRAAFAAVADLHGAAAFPVGDGIGFLGVMEFFGRDVREPNEAITDMMASIGCQISQFVERRWAEAANRREQEERRVAGHIQQGLLPRQKPILAGYEICGRCLFAADVGGDCFDYILFATARCLGVLVADASGHSIGAALLVAETRAYVRALALTCSDIDHLLGLVNKRIADDPERQGFVTALLLRLEAGNGSLTYSNAGHWSGMVFDRRGMVREQLESTGLPLGIDRTAEFPLKSAKPLQPGELILLFSDGAVEACSPAGELFGVDRLLGVVRTHRDKTPEEVLDAVFQAITRFCGGQLLLDDVTLIIVKRQSHDRE